MSQLTSSQIQYEMEHETDNAAPRMLASYIVCLVLAYIAVALRFLSRRISKSQINDSDYVIVAATVSDFFLGQPPKWLRC